VRHCLPLFAYAERPLDVRGVARLTPSGLDWRPSLHIPAKPMRQSSLGEGAANRHLSGRAKDPSVELPRGQSGAQGGFHPWCYGLSPSDELLVFRKTFEKQPRARRRAGFR